MILATLKEVFRAPLYIAIALSTAVVIFLFSVWAANIMLLWDIVTSSAISINNKLDVLVGFAGSIQTNFTFFSASYILAISVLFGVNLALMVYYIRQRRGAALGGGKSAAGSIGGLVSGILGLGCATCGTALIGPALAFFGATGVLALLPLEGGEFGILSMALLAFSIFFLSKKIQAPLVCSV